MDEDRPKSRHNFVAGAPQQRLFPKTLARSISPTSLSAISRDATRA
jgi:hypothetical protein